MIGHDTRTDEAVAEYVDALVQLHRGRHYPGFLAAIRGEPLAVLEGLGDGLTTVAVRQEQLSRSWLAALMGFRLAQFARTGLVDTRLIGRRGLVHEPIAPETGAPTVQVVTVTDEGRIVGSVALVGSDDARPRPLDAADRASFPVEAAHDVDLLSRFAAPGRTTHGALEIKRFVRDRDLAPGPQRHRVPWHLIAGMGQVVLADPATQVLVGDASERGALRHLRLVGMDTLVLEATSPWLPRTELMWPSYELPATRRAKPFVGLVTADTRRALDAVHHTLRLPASSGWTRRAVRILLVDRGA